MPPVFISELLYIKMFCCLFSVWLFLSCYLCSPPSQTQGLGLDPRTEGGGEAEGKVREG